MLMSGCYSIQVASSQDFSNCRLAAEEDRIPAGHMLVQNEGWFLFDKLPIVCGNANTESWFPWTFFSDEVSMDYVQKAIVRRAKVRGERIVQMNAINHNQTLITLPGTQGFSVPYIICHHKTQISVVFLKAAEPAELPVIVDEVADVEDVAEMDEIADMEEVTYMEVAE